MEKLNNFNPNLRYTYESSEKGNLIYCPHNYRYVPPPIKKSRENNKSKLYFLNMNDENKKVFSPRPMIPFRSPPKISSYLVRTKLYHLDRVVRSTKCVKKRYEVCLNVSETNIFTSKVTGETYKINHKLNCDDKFLIYLLSYKFYEKRLRKQLTILGINGITTRIMIESILLRRAVWKNILFKHFNSMRRNGFLNNISITFIDKTDGKNPKKREDYWRRTLETYSHFGPNVEDSV